MTAAATDTTHSGNALLRASGLNAARWTGGFMRHLDEVTRHRLVPKMGEMMFGDERVKFVGNFEVAIGKVEGRHRGPRWNDGDFYKWLEAAVVVNHASPSEELSTRIDEVIALIVATQRADGYLHTDVQIRQRNGEAVEPLGNPMDFEVYNLGHLMQAAVVHHRLTGRRELLDAAIRAADFLDRTFAAPTAAVARHGICPTHLMGLVELSRATGDEKHLRTARRMLAMRDLVVGGDDDNQDRLKFAEQRTAHGHAVRATYLYSGATDLLLESEDAAIRATVEAVWDDLERGKMYINGGCGALYDGASPDGIERQQDITRVHQAFGRDYQLPQSAAHNETCAAIGHLMWSWRMLQLTGDAKYADAIERGFYNSVLAGVSVDGEKFFYTNTLRQLSTMPAPLRWPNHRQRIIGCYCCPPNVARTMAMSSSYAWLTSGRGFHAVLYGQGEATLRHDDAGTVMLRTTSDYPWDGRITIGVGVEREAEWSLFLRVPAWCDGATIDGEPASPGYAEVRRRWQDGDRVTLDLPMRPRWIVAHPLVEESVGQVAMTRGPIVYCLESADLPPGVGVSDVAVDPRSPVELTTLDELMPGARAVSLDLFIDQPANKTRLYREWRPPSRETVRSRMVPYFLWDNRGDGEMSVWLRTS